MANLYLIKMLIEGKGMSIPEFARLVDMDPSTIHTMIKRGSTTTASMEKIADALDVSPTIFYESAKSSKQPDLAKEVEHLRALIKEKDALIKEKERAIGILLSKIQEGTKEE